MSSSTPLRAGLLRAALNACATVRRLPAAPDVDWAAVADNIQIFFTGVFAKPLDELTGEDLKQCASQFTELRRLVAEHPGADPAASRHLSEAARAFAALSAILPD